MIFSCYSVLIRMVEGEGPCISGVGDITERKISVRKISVRLKRTCMEGLLHRICFSNLCTTDFSRGS